MLAAIVSGQALKTCTIGIDNTDLVARLRFEDLAGVNDTPDGLIGRR